MVIIVAAATLSRLILHPVPMNPSISSSVSSRLCLLTLHLGPLPQALGEEQVVSHDTVVPTIIIIVIMATFPRAIIRPYPFLPLLHRGHTILDLLTPHLMSRVGITTGGKLLRGILPRTLFSAQTISHRASVRLPG
jgi:hypothetical protein